VWDKPLGKVGQKYGISATTADVRLLASRNHLRSFYSPAAFLNAWILTSHSSRLSKCSKRIDRPCFCK
jgi:hypothetical protein